MSILHGQTALVTGASQGIGRAVALALADAGANVVVNYRAKKEYAEEVMREITSRGGQGLAIQADVADYNAVENMIRQAVAQFGRLDIAVSNAVYSDRDSFWQIPMEGFRRTIDVTMWGAFHLVRAATLQMLAQKETDPAPEPANIVIISSPHAFIPIPRAMAYNMAKGAIDQMARTAAIELAPHRIRVNMVHPGWIDTPGERKYASDETIRAAGEKLPWGRLGQPEEVGRGVVFLCDPASDYMTGSSILIDGGVTLPWWASRGSGVPE